MNTKSADSRTPSPLIFTLLVFAALGYAAYLSPQRWSAAGLACITASALVATPELVEHLLLTASHPRAQSAARWISRLTWTIARIVYLAFAVVALLLIGSALVGALSAGAALASVAILIGVVGATEFVRRQLRGIVSDIISGGEVDQQLQKRHGEWRWPLAGALFLLGTLLQLIGTFVE
jgi:hypothetical protein